MNIIDQYNYKKVKLKGHIFQLIISEPFITELYIDIHFIKMPKVFNAGIIVDILNKIKPSLEENQKLQISSAEYNHIPLFDVLGINDSTRFNTIDDEIKRFENHSSKQVDLTEQYRIANVRKAKAEKVLEYIKRKYTKLDDHDISVSYSIYPNVRYYQQKLINYIYVNVDITYYTENFRKDNRDLYIQFKNKLKDEIEEFLPFDLKKYDEIEIFSKYVPRPLKK